MLELFRQRVERMRTATLCRKLFQPLTEHGQRLAAGIWPTSAPARSALHPH
jgi:hypothetical protein